MYPKVSIVTSYHNRKPHFLKTLGVLDKHPSKDFEVVIVDDASEEEHRLEDDLDYSFETTLIRIDPEHKTHRNPCVPFNMGFSSARGEKIIIQNPECLWAGDLITAALQTEENEYTSFCCYSFDHELTVSLLEKDISGYDFDSLRTELRQLAYSLRQISVDNSWPDRGRAWFNHHVFRPTAYHFASAINRKDLEELGGFDERFAHGVGYDDTEFITRVRRKMKIKFCEELVIHLDHPQHCFQDADSIAAYHSNRKIFEEVTLKQDGWKIDQTLRRPHLHGLGGFGKRAL